jgi:hypothetical protein
VIHNQFPGDLGAQAYFDKVLSKTARIIRRAKKRATTGKIVGERAEVVMQGDSLKGQNLAILYTYGANYIEILSSSKSFGRSRELEKWVIE